MAYKGKNAKVFYADGEGRLTDLSPDAGEIGISWPSDFSAIETFGSDHMARIGIRTDIQVAFSTLYYGDRAKAVRDSAVNFREGTVLIAKPSCAYIGKVVSDGVEVSTPYDGLASASPTVQGAGRAYIGRLSNPVTLNDAAQKNLPNAIAGQVTIDADRMWIMVTQAAETEDALIEVFDSSTGKSDAVSAKLGIREVTNLPTNPTRIKLTKAPANPNPIVQVVRAVRVGVE